MCILDHTQSTLVCLGKFLKKLADDFHELKGASTISNICTYNLVAHGSRLTRNLMFNRSIYCFIFVHTALLLSGAEIQFV